MTGATVFHWRDVFHQILDTQHFWAVTKTSKLASSLCRGQISLKEVTGPSSLHSLSVLRPHAAFSAASAEKKSMFLASLRMLTASKKQPNWRVPFYKLAPYRSQLGTVFSAYFGDAVIDCCRNGTWWTGASSIQFWTISRTRGAARKRWIWKWRSPGLLNNQDQRLGSTDWCKCENCEIMETGREYYCCQELDALNQKLDTGIN